MSPIKQIAGRLTILAAICLALSILISAPARSAGVDEPTDYKHDDYRSPVPETLAGGTVVSTDQAHEIWERGATIFIDVLPLPPKPDNLPKGTIWRQKKRDDIPGSVWLPNVGYGRLHPAMDQWYRDHLERLTGGDKTKPVLIYCLIDCWMSWNAAKRALEYGYSNIFWYPDGTDGWTFESLAVEPRTPEVFNRP
jgi:PQQ-dependent catabolism-associated CXXCW motif protein